MPLPQNSNLEDWDLWKNGEYKLCLSLLLGHYIKQLNYNKWSPLYSKLEEHLSLIRQWEDLELGDKLGIVLIKHY